MGRIPDAGSVEQLSLARTARQVIRIDRELGPDRQENFRKSGTKGGSDAASYPPAPMRQEKAT